MADSPSPGTRTRAPTWSLEHLGCRAQTHRVGPSREQKLSVGPQSTQMAKEKPEPHKGQPRKTQGGEGAWGEEGAEAAEGAARAGLLEPGSLQAGGSETVNLALFPARTAVPRTLRLLVAQSFHFL